MNYNGADAVHVAVNDLGNTGSGGALGVGGSVCLTVQAVNNAPVSSANNYAVRGDEVLVVNSPGILGNDTDVDGDTLAAKLVRGPRYGDLTLHADGSFVYTPDPSYVGIVTFAYVATDGEDHSDHTLVVIKVTAPSSPVELSSDTPGNNTTADNTTTPQAPEPTAAAPKSPYNLHALTSADLPSNVTHDDSATPARTGEHQQTSDQEIVADMSVAIMGQGFWSISTDEAHGPRTSARGRSSDDILDTVTTFVETVPVPLVPEVITPVITVAQNELADLSTLLVDHDLFHRWMIGSAVGVTTGLTVGYVFWTVRAGYLLTGLIAQVPAWRFVDPLPILNSLSGDAAPADGGVSGLDCGSGQRRDGHVNDEARRTPA